MTENILLSPKKRKIFNEWNHRAWIKKNKAKEKVKRKTNDS